MQQEKITFSIKPIRLSDDYRKKWNVIGLDDYFQLTKNGTVINNNAIYRVELNDKDPQGGIGNRISENEKYFLLLKQIEDFYPDTIIKDKDRRPYLSQKWVIIDNEGNEKVQFKLHAIPYLVGGCIYSLDNNYYNIETGYYYGRSMASMSSKQFIFIHVYEKGILKINKEDGTYEVFEK